MRTEPTLARRPLPTTSERPPLPRWHMLSTFLGVLLALVVWEILKTPGQMIRAEQERKERMEDAVRERESRGGPEASPGPVSPATQIDSQPAARRHRPHPGGSNMKKFEDPPVTVGEGLSGTEERLAGLSRDCSTRRRTWCASPKRPGTWQLRYEYVKSLLDYAVFKEEQARYFEFEPGAVLTQATEVLWAALDHLEVERLSKLPPKEALS